MINGTRIIALCAARISDNLIHELVTELNSFLVEDNCRLFVYHLCSDYYWKDEYMKIDSAIFDMMDFDVIDAVILMNDKIKSEEVVNHIIQGALSKDVPVITIDSEYENCISVGFDYRKGFESVVRHIVETHGIRDVHFMGGFRNNVFSDERMDIFKKVIEENGIPFDDSMVSYGNFWAKPAQVATEKLIAENRVPEAIICANDIMAINVCGALMKHGYKIPEQVKVTGFDGIDEIYFTDPQLTSCKCNFSQLAECLADTVKRCLSGNIDEVGRKRIIDTDFLPMNSCGCNRAHQTNDSNYMNRINNRFYRYQDDNKLLSYITERMQICKNTEELSKIMDVEVLNNLACVINKRCFDERINLSDNEQYVTFDDEMVVVRDCARPDAVPRETTIKGVYLNIGPAMEKKVPLVFNAIGYMNNLLGYLCFYFDDSDISNYGRILQIVTSLNYGIGSFVNMRHQRYLRAMVENMYKYDALTGLYNRMGFNIEFGKLAETAKAQDMNLTMILADLDGLKLINDKYGHLEGDIAIRAVADALKSACPEDALYLRLGGDEMLAVIAGECDTEQVKQDMQTYLKQYNENSDKTYEVSASIGCYQTNSDSEFDFEKLVEESDKIMYIEKQLHYKRQ